MLTLSLTCRLQEERKEACQKALEKSCLVRERQTQMYAKLKPIVTSKSAGRSSKLPRPPQTTADLLASRRAYARNKAIASETRASIEAFEATMKDRMAMEQIPGSGEGLTVTSPKPGENATETSSPTALVVSAFLFIQDLYALHLQLHVKFPGKFNRFIFTTLIPNVRVSHPVPAQALPA